MRTTKKHASILYAAAACWLGLIVSGSAALWRYKQTPSADLLAPVDWPVQSKLARATELPTLLLFLHPRCACSHASVEELSRLMTRAQGLVRAHVVFFRPDGSTPSWSRGALWSEAAAIPGVALSEDEGAIEARRFHGETSGHAVLYDAHGHRIFDGGITAARGHAGDSAGSGALLALLQGQSAKHWHTPIFGCRIREQQ